MNIVFPFSNRSANSRLTTIILVSLPAVSAESYVSNRSALLLGQWGVAHGVEGATGAKKLEKKNLRASDFGFQTPGHRDFRSSGVYFALSPRCAALRRHADPEVETK